MKIVFVHASPSRQHIGVRDFARYAWAKGLYSGKGSI